MERLRFKAILRLLSSHEGGKHAALRNDYRPSWDLGATWLGEPTTNDGRVLLDDGLEIVPGSEGECLIEPLAPEFWGRVRVGAGIPMQEGHRVVGQATILAIVSSPDFFSADVCEFVLQARQYCDFVATCSARPLPERLAAARMRLLELYRAGTALPRLEPPDGIEAGPSPDSPKGWVGFEQFDAYCEIFDPYEEADPVVGSLSDDMLDVYKDVRRGLTLWDKVVPRSAALWEWRFHFDCHWGDHAVDALRALHRACLKT